MAATRLFLWIVLIGFALVSKSSMKKVKIISQEIKVAFNHFDKDRDGFITVQELGTALQETMGITLTKEECETTIKALNKNGKLDLEDFNTMMSTGFATRMKAMKSQNSTDEDNYEMSQNTDDEDEFTRSDVWRLFKDHDSDGDGLINAQDLHNTMARTGGNMTMEECQLLIEDFDKDKDGMLDYTEFVNLAATKIEEEDENSKKEKTEYR